MVSLPDEERVAWMWVILAAFAIPEFGAFIRSVRICFFKSSKKPRSIQFIVVNYICLLFIFFLAIFNCLMNISAKNGIQEIVLD